MVTTTGSPSSTPRPRWGGKGHDILFQIQSPRLLNHIDGEEAMATTSSSSTSYFSKSVFATACGYKLPFYTFHNLVLAFATAAGCKTVVNLLIILTFIMQLRKPVAMRIQYLIGRKSIAIQLQNCNWKCDCIIQAVAIRLQCSCNFGTGIALTKDCFSTSELLVSFPSILS